jgi:hypothetical protein
LARLGRHADAVQDWGRAITLDAGPELNPLRLRRALSLAHSGEHARAAAEVEELTSAPSTAQDFLSFAAGVLGIAAGKVQDARLAEQYATRAVALLRRAVEGGYKDLDHVKKDPRFDALRQRDDFKKLLEDLQKSLSPGQ